MSLPIKGGDQSPLAGGLLRVHVLRQAGHSVAYDLHDTDAPWVVGGREVGVARRFADYWALASRFPWSPDHPKEGWVDAIGSATGAPRGLAFLSGPSTSLTIRSVLNGAAPRVQHLKGGLLEDEVRWADRLLELAGRSRDQPGLVETALRDRATPFALIQQIGRDLGGGQDLGTSTEFYRAHPVRFATRAMVDHYWVIDRMGHRSPYYGSTIREGEVLVPRGKMLPIEVAAAGYTDTATGLGYIKETQALRDQVAPGLKIPYLIVSFDWHPPFDPFEVLWSPYAERKRRRGQETDSKLETQLRASIDYWRTRPTVISWAALGGDLRAKITPVEY